MNKVVLITGANRGIGLAASELFLNKGYDVIFTARDEIKGKKAMKSLGESARLHFHRLDISSDDSVNKILSYVEDSFGRLDVLVNNAAINYDTWQKTVSADMNLVLDTINVNVLGAWRLIQAFTPMMKKKSFGRIVNMSSGLGAFKGMGSGTPAYSISKAALNALTVKMGNVFGGTNIKVNALCPGWVRTDMGGMGATLSPEEAAEEIYWLASNDELQGQFIRYRNVIDY
ncbi:SDR family NAD(P)-dependent oxidoreductase [Acidaminobacter sp. JC074]|uniref:SDR family NAD(P)-dependent oxidoreductase n=1 Tax=Acidaminobacter sp. JC074 TaxID=2530199 RepID=UPI001F112BAE|nr:SDR family NAD(P)-dependent oxidoreductase [Acidaminobacter sp. JC074]